MLSSLKSLFRSFTSLRLTVVLLVFSMLLVFFATLAQRNIGVWAVQTEYFRTLFVMTRLSGTGFAIPWFPGGYLIGGLLLINLTAAHAYRLKLTWTKSGLWLTHFGLILLLLGELFTGLWQQESLMFLDQNATKAYSESRLLTELAVIDTTDPKFDDVVAIPMAALESLGTIQYPRLPFRIHATAFYPNSTLRVRSRISNAQPSPADQGFGPQFLVLPQPITYKQDEQNTPSAVLELTGADGPLGTWLVSMDLTESQSLTVQGHTYQLILRATRHYHPVSLTLLKFSHDRYPGTDIPKNFSSRVRLQTPDGRVDREVLIYMNNPLRYGGFAFYQSGYQPNDRGTILQVVRNPSWLLPYVSCVLMGVGLAVQFGIHLTRFLRKRTATPSAAAATAG